MVKLGLFFLLSSALSFGATIIPSSRMVPWQGKAGIPGGIPDTSTMTIFTNFTSSASVASVAAAISACPSNQVVHLAAGTYNWSGGIDYSGRGNGKVLKGDTNSLGVPTTRIKTASGQFYLRNSADESALTVDANLTANGAKGDTTITLASVPSWVTVGDVIGLDMLDDSTKANNDGQEGPGSDNYRYVMGQGARGLAQLLKVSAKTSTNITFSPELSEDFTTNQTAQIFQPLRNPSTTGPISRIGFENIIFEHTGAAITDNHMFKVELGKECWWKNVYGTNSVGGAYIYLLGSVNCEVRHCYFDNAVGLAGGQGYGVALYHWCLECLIEDNIFRKLHVAMQSNYGSCYNVWSCNFETDGQSTSGQNPSLSCHGNASHRDVAENNWCMDKFLGDFTHGSSYNYTLFRNRILGKNPAQSGDQIAVSNERYNRLFNCVGNVLGDKTFHNQWMVASGSTYNGLGGSVTSSCSDSAIYKMGYWANISCDTSALDNFSTMNPLLAVNWDAVTSTNGGVVLNGFATSDLATSYLYSSKPAFFGGLTTWPPYGADLVSQSTNVNSMTNIPAGFRFVKNVDTPASSGSGGGSVSSIGLSGSGSLSGNASLR